MLLRLLSLVLALTCGSSALADEFTIRLDNGESTTLTARLAGTGQEAHALELADGSWQVVPSDRVTAQKAGPDPTPVTPQELLAQLTEEFGKSRVVSYVDKPYVILIVRGPGSDQTLQTDRQLQAVAQKGAKFFKGMQVSFLDFVKQARVDTTPLKYPLAAVIFESDRHFNAYAAATTGGDGLSAANMAAFYDLLSNRLVIRLSECVNFDTPLHEAVHQQVYNRGILQRLAPIPTWFNEGIATGFEGDGERIRSGPRTVSDRYGKLALRAKTVDWNEVVGNDRAFHGDVLAAEAYGHAWGLHWLLVTKYRNEYNALVRSYAARKPLEKLGMEERRTEFERLVGKSANELQREFQAELPKAMARRKN